MAAVKYFSVTLACSKVLVTAKITTHATTSGLQPRSGWDDASWEVIGSISVPMTVIRHPPILIIRIYQNHLQCNYLHWFQMVSVGPSSWAQESAVSNLNLDAGGEAFAPWAKSGFASTDFYSMSSWRHPVSFCSFTHLHPALSLVTCICLLRLCCYDMLCAAGTRRWTNWPIAGSDFCVVFDGFCEWLRYATSCASKSCTMGYDKFPVIELFSYDQLKDVKGIALQ